MTQFYRTLVFKFIVDGEWMTSLNYLCMEDEAGNVNNVISNTPSTSTELKYQDKLDKVIPSLDIKDSNGIEQDVFEIKISIDKTVKRVKPESKQKQKVNYLFGLVI
jgi:hypothetical protein